MFAKEKAVKKAVKKAVAEPTPYEIRVKKLADRDIAHRKKRERVHLGLENANA